MKQKKCKIFFLFSVSAIVLVLKTDVSNGCGWSPEPDSYYSIFEPALFNLPLFKPFFLSENDFFPYEETSSLSEKTDNLKDWLSYFKKTPTLDDINDVIYSSKKEDIQNIIKYLRSGEDSLISQKYKVNTLIAYLKKHNQVTILDYLLFTKLCEPYIAVRDDWETHKRDTTGMSYLINLGQKKFTSCKDSFLKDRYAFQIIRLEHYSYHYKETIRLYDKYFGKNKNSLISYWALEHKAGCLYKLSDIGESNYLLAKIFDKCPSRRRSCSHGFRLCSDSLNQIFLSRFKNTNEKTAYIFLTSYKSGEIDVKAIEEIYKLNPRSKYLELMLERGISKMEREILPPTYYNLQSIGYYFNYYITEPYKEFGKIINKIAGENKTEHPYLWYFAAGYISTLNHQTNVAEEYFLKAKKTCPKDDLTYINRIKIVEIISKVDGLKKIDGNAETQLYDDLNRLRNNRELEKLKSQEAFYYIMSLLGQKYYLQNDTVKANLCMGTRVTINEWGNMTPALGYDLRKDYFKEPLQKIYDFIVSERISQFGKFLVNNYSFKGSQIREILATRFLLHHDFEEAQRLLTDAPWFPDWPMDDLVNLPADPFIIHINDCHDCDYSAAKEKVYNKKSFVEKMMELENLVQEDTVNSGKYYFLLANGYYNITFYGNAWKAAAYERTFPDWRFEIDRTLPKEFYDCSTAQEYYVRAMKAAKDREFAAQCCFMASKCEQNKFYTEAYKDSLLHHNPEKYFGIKNNFRNFFRILKNKYPDTKFYQEAIEECKYFGEFVKNN